MPASGVSLLPVFSFFRALDDVWRVEVIEFFNKVVVVKV
jgi:hypothetical protein